MLKQNKILTGFAVIAVMLVSLSAIRADEWDKKTILTINQPIRIPGAVLAPGTYVFKLADLSSDRDVVQVFNERQNHLIATIFAIPDRRVERTDKTELEFWETPTGSPIALRSWFYPGDYRGFEFPYPKRQAESISARVYRSVPVLERAEVNVKRHR